VDFLQTFTLSMIQGITEFLPISSSAHLILPSQLLGWTDQGQAFDVAVHLGSLCAVLIYFRKDLIELTQASLKAMFSFQHTKKSRFALNLVLASLPIIPAGLLLKDIAEVQFRSIEVIAAATIAFGLALWYSDYYQRANAATEINEAESLTLKHAMLIGFAQCFALIPGTSRSGATMTMGLLCGYGREAVSKISFLLSIPAIAGAGLLKTADLITGDSQIDWQTLALGSLISGVSAYLCIHLFLDYINRLGFLPFVIYRLVLGAVLLVLVL
jgi:undecaprenyl-diphosphatase